MTGELCRPCATGDHGKCVEDERIRNSPIDIRSPKAWNPECACNHEIADGRYSPPVPTPIRLAPPPVDERPMPDEVYLIVCRDGRPHTGFRQGLTRRDAEEILLGSGQPMTALDDWGHRCKPHRIQRYVPAPHE